MYSPGYEPKNNQEGYPKCLKMVGRFFNHPCSELFDFEVGFTTIRPSPSECTHIFVHCILRSKRSKQIPRIGRQGTKFGFLQGKFRFLPGNSNQGINPEWSSNEGKFQEPPSTKTPPYYSHTTPIRISWSMGMAWETFENGVPTIGSSWTNLLSKSANSKLAGSLSLRHRLGLYTQYWNSEFGMRDQVNNQMIKYTIKKEKYSIQEPANLYSNLIYWTLKSDRNPTKSTCPQGSMTIAKH